MWGVECGCMGCEGLIDAVKRLAVARLAQALMGGVVAHTNRDAVFSPSQWDVDSARTVRHTLSTQAAWDCMPGRFVLVLNFLILDV